MFVPLCVGTRICACVRACVRACMKISACSVPECMQDSKPDSERTRDLADGRMGL